MSLRCLNYPRCFAQMNKSIRFFIVMTVLVGVAGIVTGCASSKELIAPCRRPAEMQPFTPISQMDCQVMMPVNTVVAAPAAPETVQ